MDDLWYTESDNPPSFDNLCILMSVRCLSGIDFIGFDWLTSTSLSFSYRIRQNKRVDKGIPKIKDR